MSLAMLEHTKDDIQEAYQTNSLAKIGKETLYVFDRVVHFMLSAFKDRLKGIIFETNDFDFDETYLRSQKNMNYMLKMLEVINQLEFTVDDSDCGQMKVDVERWYYLIGGEAMYFEYRVEYILKTHKISDMRTVILVTVFESLFHMSRDM